MVMQGLMFVGRYRYDGLYLVDSVSVILTSWHYFLILAQATMRRGKGGYNMCFFELSVRITAHSVFLTEFRTIREWWKRVMALCQPDASSL